MVGWEPYLFNWAAPPNNVVKGITETVVISEQRARVSTHARTLEESVISDATPTRQIGLNKLITETLLHPLSASTSFTGLSFSVESFGAESDAVARVKTLVRPLSQITEIGESLSRRKGGNASIGASPQTEIITISDLLGLRLTNKIRHITTEPSFIDLSFTSTSFQLVNPHAIIVTDSVTFVKPVGLTKTITETVTIGEAVAKLETKARVAIETESVTDSILNVSEKVREITDDVAESSDVVDVEVITEASIRTRTLIESEDIGEDILQQTEKVRTIDETEVITDRLQGWAKGIPMQAEAVIPDITNIIGAREFYIRPQAPRPPRFEYAVENTVYAPLKLLATLDNRISLSIRARDQTTKGFLTSRLRTQALHTAQAHSPLLATPYPTPIKLSLRLPKSLSKLESSLQVYQPLAQVALEPRKIINIERKYRTLKAYLLLHMVESLE